MNFVIGSQTNPLKISSTALLTTFNKTVYSTKSKLNLIFIRIWCWEIKKPFLRQITAGVKPQKTERKKIEIQPVKCNTNPFSLTCLFP